MSLGDFYKQTEKIIINDIVAYLAKSRSHKYIKILNLYVSPIQHIKEYPHMVDLGVSDDPNEFLKNITEYQKSLRGQKFDIVNCRFSARSFMLSMKEIMGFIGFIADTLRPGGIFMGFLIDVNKLNGIFTESTSMTGGPYKIEYVQRYDDNDIFSMNQVIINGETANIINFTTLQLLCKQFGLIHIDNIILESLYYNSLNYLTLTDYEKQFGFLNYVFLFQKV
jgi:hypothetical protein